MAPTPLTELPLRPPLRCDVSRRYMTGGHAVVLGPVGKNFGAGMSGGLAFVLTRPAGAANAGLDGLRALCNKDVAGDLSPLEDERDVAKVRAWRCRVLSLSTFAPRVWLPSSSRHSHEGGEGRNLRGCSCSSSCSSSVRVRAARAQRSCSSSSSNTVRIRAARADRRSRGCSACLAGAAADAGSHGVAQVKELLEAHVAMTGSVQAAALLADWPAAQARFVKVYPHEFRAALEKIAAEAEQARRTAWFRNACSAARREARRLQGAHVVLQ